MNENHPRILIIKLGALGDFIQALGPMAAIRKRHPAAHITILTTKPYAEMARACEYADAVEIDTRPRFPDLRGIMDLRRRLIAGNFTRVYDLQNNDRTALYLRFFPRRIRPEWVGAAPGASHRNADPARAKGTAFAGHVQTLALGGIKDIAVDPLEWAKGSGRDYGARAPYALLVPGSAPTRLDKRWPAAHFAELAGALIARGIQPVLIGTKAEEDVTRAIMAAHPQCLDLTAQTALFDLPALARAAIGAVGNDTGPMHMVGPTGRPCLVLFSKASDPLRHAPLGPQVETMRVDALADLQPAAVTDKFFQMVS